MHLKYLPNFRNEPSDRSGDISDNSKGKRIAALLQITMTGTLCGVDIERSAVGQL